MSKDSWTFPADTERKLNVHKTFRRRPGRLLNFLFTFNLRLVCTELLDTELTCFIFPVSLLYFSCCTWYF